MKELTYILAIITVISLTSCGNSTGTSNKEEINPVENLPNWTRAGSDSEYQLNEKTFKVTLNIDYKIIIGIIGESFDFNLVGLNDNFFYPGLTEYRRISQDSAFVTREYGIECTETPPNIDTLAIRTSNNSTYKTSVDGIEKIIKYVRCK